MQDLPPCVRGQQSASHTPDLSHGVRGCRMPFSCGCQVGAPASSQHFLREQWVALAKKLDQSTPSAASVAAKFTTTGLLLLGFVGKVSEFAATCAASERNGQRDRPGSGC